MIVAIAGLLILASLNDCVPGRPDLSCVKITEPLLMNLVGETRESIQATMRATGRAGDGPETLHIESIYPGDGSGDLDVYFENGLPVIIAALVNRAGRQIEFIWNAHAMPSMCSDFDRQPQPCTQ